VSEPVVPRFAVVGRVNKGKSSVIATLAEDDRIDVSPLPGTTTEASEFPVVVDGRTLFTLIDTPGFEQAALALASLEQEPTAADQRPERVRAFVQQARARGEFPEECKLLTPILAGAAILYVVDGEKPYRENYRAEMEILRWTGEPSMALINRVGSGEHLEGWRRALNQYFKVVREFDAQQAGLEERIRLLTTLRELHEPFRAPVQAAIDALLAEDERRRTESVHVLCELLIGTLTFSLEARAPDSLDPRKLEQEFHDRLRSMELEARDKLARLYQHDRAVWQKAQDLARPVFGEDLFAERTWLDLGLSGTQLLATYAVSGALTGGLIDASVGGASFGAGAALGALLGAGATALHLTHRFERATRLDGVVDRLRSAVASGPAYRVGPLKHPNFPFVLLDRALRYHDAVRQRAHALSAAGKEITTGPEQSGLGQRLSAERRKALVSIFSKLQRRAERPSPELHAALFREVRALLAEAARPAQRA
jgi:PAS domain-containing protein